MLVEAFIERLTRERAVAGPFAPVRIVVPNRHVEAYVRLHVAERCGIAANIEASFLRKVLAGIVENRLCDVRVADATHIEGHLLALLHDEELLGRAALAEVRGYLDAGRLDRDALDRRRCQLARVLAHLFEEYAVSRPQMIDGWAAPSSGAVNSDLERWQRTLWRAVFAAGGRLEKQAETTGVRVDRLEALWSLAMTQTPMVGEPTLHVLGLSYMAIGYHQMLASLGKVTDVYVYTLNACREDDLRARDTVCANDPYGLTDEPHPVLRRWARPGRENLRLLVAAADGEIDARFGDEAGGSLLHHLQRNIVEREPPEQGRATALDGSLRVLACPSVRRELEVVAAEIWKLARRDPSLRLCDVAVIVPDAGKELYLAQLPSVFRESCDLPHTIADTTAGSLHRVAEAISLLLRLPLTSFTRKELLPLLTHPCVMGRFAKATAQEWRDLCHELGIVRGAFRNDLDGTYVTRDLFTWDQGLRRLVLGAFVDPMPTEAAGPVDGKAVILPGPAIGLDNEEALGFGLLARSLVADARFAAGQGRTPERLLGDWLDFIRALVGSYIVLDDSETVGKGIVAQFLAEIDKLPDLGLGQQRVSYRVAAELALRVLDGLPSPRGQYLAHGVTVASFVPMRAIPFRAVFVVGLGQNGFPRASSRHELDLRAGQRLAGDVDGREQDLYMFLETLLSTREHVTLSYVARDEVTGDELPCSQVLLELRAFLGQGLLAPADLERLFEDDRPALRRYDDVEERRQLLPAAQAEHLAKQSAGKVTSPRVVLAVDKPMPPWSDPAAPVRIPLWALRRFLEDPLQGSARFRLGMRDDDRSARDTEDEPFDMDKGRVTSLVRSTMATVLREPRLPERDVVGAAYERHAATVELSGASPTGLFRTASLALEKEMLVGWCTLAQDLLGRETPYRKIRFTEGAVSYEGQADFLYQPAPVLSVELPLAGAWQRRDVRVGGTTGLFGSATILSFTCRAGISDAGVCREDVWAFLDGVTMAAAGVALPVEGFQSAVFYVADGQPRMRTRLLPPLDRDCARDYLAALCADLLTGDLDARGEATGVHPYLLPHEAILESHRKGTRVGDEIAALCAASEGERGGFSSLRGPVPAVLARYAAPPEPNIAAMVNRRFGRLLSKGPSEGPRHG